MIHSYRVSLVRAMVAGLTGAEWYRMGAAAYRKGANYYQDLFAATEVEYWIELGTEESIAKNRRTHQRAVEILAAPEEEREAMLVAYEQDHPGEIWVYFYKNGDMCERQDRELAHRIAHKEPWCECWCDKHQPHGHLYTEEDFMFKW